MFGELFIVLCWKNEALVGVYTDQEESLEIAKAYAALHKCKVDIQKYVVALN